MSALVLEENTLLLGFEPLWPSWHPLWGRWWFTSRTLTRFPLALACLSYLFLSSFFVLPFLSASFSLTLLFLCFFFWGGSSGSFWRMSFCLGCIWSSFGLCGCMALTLFLFPFFFWRGRHCGWRDFLCGLPLTSWSCLDLLVTFGEHCSFLSDVGSGSFCPFFFIFLAAAAQFCFLGAAYGLWLVCVSPIFWLPLYCESSSVAFGFFSYPFALSISLFAERNLEL